jgi:hypothetical protein
MTLRFGIQRLKDDFNQWSETARVLAVLSPTCPDCLEGYEMMVKMPTGPRCLVLWTAMLPGDSTGAAAQHGLADHRCTHYWEDQGWPVSTRLRPLLGLGPYDPGRSVWDVYLLYPSGILWIDEHLPPPSDWTHNLGEHGPERSRITAALLDDWSSTTTQSTA